MSELASVVPRQTTTARPRSRQRVRSWARAVLTVGGAVAVAVGGLIYWLNSGRWMATDDATVQADEMTVSTDVAGIVTDIPVHEGDQVRRGQILFRLDPDKFRIALDSAKANLAQTRLSLLAMQADYQALLRQVAARQAQVRADQATYDRYAALVKTHAVTAQETDDARFKLAADQQATEAAAMQAQSALAKLGGSPDSPVEQMPAYQQAAQQVAEAQRQMNHATVRAPYDGIVTQVSKLQPGMFLPASTGAFGLVSTQNVWVQAEPKESELTYARAGQPAEVTIDAYPGKTWKGVVESISPATDQQFSLLPAQNSSGNWVKVVQRVPVRVRIDRQPDDPPLAAGMSATISIDTDHRRSLADLF